MNAGPEHMATSHMHDADRLGIVLQVIAHVVPIGNQVNDPIITFTPGKGAATRLVTNGDYSDFSCSEVYLLDPHTSRRRHVGYHPGKGFTTSGWDTDKSGQLQAAFQGPRARGPYIHPAFAGTGLKADWTIRAVDGGPVLFAYEQDWCRDMFYPTWACASEGLICCAVRQCLSTMEQPQTFLRFGRCNPTSATSQDKCSSQPATKQHASTEQHGCNASQPPHCAWGAELHTPHASKDSKFPKFPDDAQWVKEAEVKLPYFGMLAVCPAGRIVVQIHDREPRTLVHFDTAEPAIWKIMQAGSQDDFPSPSIRWVPARPKDPARFLYVAAGVNGHVAVVDAKRHAVLYAWTAASLLQVQRPRKPHPEAWHAMKAADLRRVRGNSKQIQPVQFLGTTCGFASLAAGGGTIALFQF